MIKKHACSQASMPCGRVMSRRRRSHRVPFYVVVVDDYLLVHIVCVLAVQVDGTVFVFSSICNLCVSLLGFST